MTLTTPTRLLPLSITVAPLPADQVHALTRGAGVLVCVTDLEAGVALPEDRAREVFGLTPAEARVAALLFEGLEPKAVARRLECSINTVRIHMAHIFQKTETGGQADLARLMTRLIGAPEV
jgi:DNA-binding CsgD family transcriptional regulator